MFKVLCIDGCKGSVSSPSGWEVNGGQIYSVCDDYKRDSILFYRLSEDPDHKSYGWNSNRFIPLSNIDEMDLSEALQEVEDFESGKKVPMPFEKFLQTL